MPFKEVLLLSFSHAGIVYIKKTDKLSLSSMTYECLSACCSYCLI